MLLSEHLSWHSSVLSIGNPAAAAAAVTSGTNHGGSKGLGSLSADVQAGLRACMPDNIS